MKDARVVTQKGSNVRIGPIRQIARLVIPAILISFAGFVTAYAGQITGTVLDEKSGTPLIGASVQIEGTTIGAACDFDGRYTIRNVPDGSHTILVQSVGYTAKRIAGVNVKGNEPITLDASLPEAVTELKPIEVTAERAKATESSMLTKRRTAASATDGISAEMIRKSGDANAGDALRRVTGVSVVDGRSLVVRGMGGRYSTVQLNGTSLPSLEPNRKEVPLDLFPSGLLDVIETSKTYTPDLPGNFCGGSVDLTTRDFPTRWMLSFSSNTSSNTVATGKERLTGAEGQKSILGMDLGYDDGTRSLPSALQSPAWSSDTAVSREVGWNLGSRRWTPVTARTPMNGGYGLTMGNSWNFGNDRKLGMLASWTYGNSYKIINNHYREWGFDTPQIDLNVTTGVQSVTWGGIFNSTLAMSNNHKVSFKGLIDRSADDEARKAIGYDEELGPITESRLRFLSRSVSSGQFSGDHNLDGLLHSKVEWRASYTRARRQEPEIRSSFYLLNFDYAPGDTTLIFRQSGYSGSNIVTDFIDRAAQFGWDWTIPLSGQASRLKLGGLFKSDDREFSANRYRFVNFGGRAPEMGLAEDIFVDQNIGPGRNQYVLENGTYPDDGYNGNEHTSGAYGMLDVPVVHRVRFVGGARFEQERLKMNTGDRSVPDGKIRVRINTDDWLPMASLIWAPSELMNFRGVISRTLERPEYRELSLAQFQEYATGATEVGNPNLKTCYITNYDIRWEFFPNPGSLLAASFFWKSFDKPIERVTSALTSSRLTFTYANSEYATDRGIELEARRSLGFLSERLDPFAFSGNLTLVHSKSRTAYGAGEGTYFVVHPLDGQSPYTVNTMLTYTSPKGRTEFGILLNAFGDRLVRVGHVSVNPYYEAGRTQVDGTFSTKIWQGVGLKAMAKNITGAHYRVIQKQVIGTQTGQEAEVENYKLGVTWGVGLTFSL